ncbi:hypothetical protein BS50DRAFT_484673 [Corynespora cassiicola Philippines]|uniref:MYND-type domain-containing protein n=1 Tax=Corynespora cassiicola Philippines TaxID=1448308 RepID=A0A2T2P220_CORCC|nr:hypothetical protein BS50DRAFT_484673 [Corynespora cassiicola Philippines]
MSSNAPLAFSDPWLLRDFIPIDLGLDPNSSTHLCTTCKKPATNLCTCCRNIHYCTSACQTADWPIHKLLCKDYTDVLTSPGPDFRRALLLPAEHPHPYFVWIAWPQDEPYPADMSRYFPGAEFADMGTMVFEDRNVLVALEISYDRNTTSGRELAPNKCIQRLLMYRGNFVVLAYPRERGERVRGVDVDTTVLGPVVEYLDLRASYEGPVFVEQPQKRYGETEWVRILRPVMEHIDRARRMADGRR